jgi:hypothetical protein
MAASGEKSRHRQPFNMVIIEPFPKSGWVWGWFLKKRLNTRFSFKIKATFPKTEVLEKPL